MASVLKVDKLDPQSGTALEIGTSGDTISVPSGATLDISASTLTPPATMPASSGINFTALNATNLGSGTVPTARLGSGTASSSTVLYGDQTYKAEPGGGKIYQVVRAYGGAELMTSSTYNSTGLFVAITPSATDSDIIVFAQTPRVYNNAAEPLYAQIWQGTTGEGSGAAVQSMASSGDAWTGTTNTQNTMLAYIGSVGSTSAQTFTVMHANSNNSTAVGWYQALGAASGEIVAMEILA